MVKRILAVDYDVKSLFHLSRVSGELASLPVLFSRRFLSDRTATQYDRLLASSCRPSVRPSVCLSVCNAVHYGSQCRCTGLKVVPTCYYFSLHFCWRMCRLKNESKKTRT